MNNTDFDAFKKAWEDYPSQDNEGYIPDRFGFKAGFFAALRYRDEAEFDMRACHLAAIKNADEWVKLRKDKFPDSPESAFKQEATLLMIGFHDGARWKHNEKKQE